MFENLTPRERKLATAVLGLVPASIVFMGIFWFINTYGANNDTAMRLLTDIETEENRMIEGVEAGRRRAFYSSVSLPPSMTRASNEYQSWLKLLCESVQLDINNVTPRDASDIKFKRDVIGRRRVFSVQARGNLQQLNEFLTRFHEVDLLHRINTLKVIPLTEGAGEKKVRNGQLSIIMAIEVVSLLEADNREEFTNVLKPSERELAEFQQILRRNVFGPANNEPLLSVRSTTVNSGTDASISVSARDADDQDNLTFELLESSVDGAELEQSDPTDRRARMKVPSQEPGEYEFKVRVVDNGFPAKESIESFTVTFREPPKPPEPKVDPPKPKFKHAPHTRVTGIAKNRAGDWQVWITFRTLQDEDENGLRLRLKEGETFELDDETWVVTKITPDEAYMTAGDKFYVARPNPRDRGILTEVPGPDKGEADGGSESASADSAE